MPDEPAVQGSEGLPPDAGAAREWLETMVLIRRFEERAGEMYAKAKVGGFLHLAIGEEATIVGAARALRERDYLISTYRSHGHALARGTSPDAVMAELFGKVDGCCKGRGGSMHMFDLERRFMGGYGIVGGNLPLAAGFGLASDYLATDDATLCTFGDGASNQGTFGETMNLAALWHLPVVFMVTNNRFGMGTSLERHSAVTDLVRKGESFGVPGMRCDGMDVVDTHAVCLEALRIAREERRPVLVEALTYRFRGHSMADPEEYRTKEQVAEWRLRDPLRGYGDRLEAAGVITGPEREQIDAHLATCPDCAGQLGEESVFRSAFSTTSQPADELDPTGSLLAQCRSELSEQLDDLQAPPMREHWVPFGWVRRWMALRPAWSAAGRACSFRQNHPHPEERP